VSNEKISTQKLDNKIDALSAVFDKKVCYA